MKDSANSAVPIRNIYFFMSSKGFYLEIVMSMSHKDLDSNKLWPRIYFSPFFTGLLLIRITCPCDLYPLTPHLYIVKLGCTGVYIFSYFCSKT